MKNEKKFWVQNLKWATAHLSRRLGAGQRRGALGWGAGRAQAGTAGVLGRWAWRASRRAWARGQAQAGGSSARAQRARGRARQLGAGARGAAGRGNRRGRARGARPGRGWALGAAWAGLGQCTRCTRPIFDQF